MNSNVGASVLNGICPYYTMYPLDFPLTALKRAEKDDWVYDPFCGRGTTNFAARLRGLNTVGVDSNPVAAAIAAAKLVAPVPDGIVVECEKLLACNSHYADVPKGEFWQLCYEEQTLLALCQLRTRLLEDCISDERIALRAILLGALHGPQSKTKDSYFSNQMPRTYAAKPDYAVKFWKERGFRPRRVDILAVVQERASRYYGYHIPQVCGKVIQGDSRDITIPSVRPIKWIVTSPPYYGMRTYVPDQWLRNWFLGGPPEVVYISDDQLMHSSPALFAHELSIVWKRLASMCDDRARLIIRFGGIHNRKAHPREIMRDSLRLADSHWRLRTVRSAGCSTAGNRQANQFVRSPKHPIEEFDFYARLE
jgi:hypothetical protein